MLFSPAKPAIIPVTDNHRPDQARNRHENPRFYEDQPLTNGQEVQLSDAVVQHVARALRMRPDDQLTLFNGDGNEYHARLSEVAKRKVSAQIESVSQPARISPLNIQIGQSLSGVNVWTTPFRKPLNWAWPA